MSFGRRSPGTIVAKPVSRAQRASSARRPGGLLRACAILVATFLASAAAATTISLLASPPQEAGFGLKLLAYAVVGGGPPAIINNLVGLVLGDFILSRLRIKAVAAYVLACGLLPPVFMISVMKLTANAGTDVWTMALVGPCALAAAWALGLSRREAPEAEPPRIAARA